MIKKKAGGAADPGHGGHKDFKHKVQSKTGVPNPPPKRRWVRNTAISMFGIGVSLFCISIYKASSKLEQPHLLPPHQMGQMGKNFGTKDNKDNE